MASSAERIVTRFGSQARLAELIGSSQTTVAYWVKVGTIPARWHKKIREAAESQGFTVEPAEFVNLEAPKPPVGSPIAVCSADLIVGDDPTAAIACYVLSDGRRVISRTSALRAIASSESATVGGDLVRYVKPAEAFLKVDLADEMIKFDLDNVSNKEVYGITAECFLDICRAFVKARDAGVLETERQQEIAIKAGAFLSACANVGLIALIDEATGYQYTRADDALRVKLRAYLEEQMRPWEKTFPDELWIEFGRLTNWKGGVQQRPKYWGKLVNELVYEYLDKDVFEWLKENAPPPRHGQNYHQWLTSNYGLRKLIEHIWMLVGMAAACQTMEALRYRMAERFGKQPFQMMLFIDPPGTD